MLVLMGTQIKTILQAYKIVLFSGAIKRLVHWVVVRLKE
jgi:hypothetical protein